MFFDILILCVVGHMCAYSMYAGDICMNLRDRARKQFIDPHTCMCTCAFDFCAGKVSASEYVTFRSLCPVLDLVVS